MIKKKSDKIVIDGKKFSSRLIMGTSLYPNLDVLNESLNQSETEIITVSIRRFNDEGKNLFLDQIKKKIYIFTKHSWMFYKKRGSFYCRISQRITANTLD